MRPLSCVDNGDRKLRPGDVTLNEGALVVGEAGHHRRSQFIRCRCVRDAKARAPLMGLHHHGKTQMTCDDGKNLLRPHLTEIGLWKCQRVRSNHSTGANARLRGWFEGGPLAAV